LRLDLSVSVRDRPKAVVGKMRKQTLSDEVETGEKPEILKVSTQKLPLFSMVEFSEIGFFYRLVRPQAC